MTASVIRVLLVDDSAVVRGALRQIVDAQPDLRVVATAPNGRVGLEELARTPADVVLLDVEMPEMDGLATLPRILKAHPRVRVIMASSLTQSGARVTMDALAMGAADYITKPTARAGPVALAALAGEIVEKIRAIGGSDRRRQRITIAPPAPAVAPAPRPPRPTPTILGGIDSTPGIIAIASSTGGPNALVTVLRSLPRSCNVPVLITQHMPPVFTMLLAQRLQRESGRTCVEATDGAVVQPNCVYVAPGDFHMTVEPRDGVPHVRVTQGPPENHCRPAADPMFRSVASLYGSSTLAVVLTGMGDDGRRGCEAVRQRGGRVMIQDEATSIVWGMPGAVSAAGLANWVHALPDIGARIGALCKAAA